jgi:hypothetical protein
MSKKNFDRRLAALDDLRNAPDSPARSAGLRKALADRNSYIVAKAAGIAGQLGLNDLIPDLLSAMDRFFVNPTKSDPQCWAKNAIVESLAKLEDEDSAVFIRGLRHVQIEPVWGGQQDSAGPLRAKCALALVQCRDLRDSDILSHLIEALADRETTVRIDAARAIGRMSGDAPALLLRLRALVADGEPEVVGACLTSLLAIQGEAACDFVSRFLQKGEEEAREAAFALASLRNAKAFAILKQAWDHGADISVRGALLTAMVLTRVPEAIEFVISLIESDSQHAAAAVEALAPMRSSEEIQSRTAVAVERSGNARLRAAFEQSFRGRS